MNASMIPIPPIISTAQRVNQDAESLILCLCIMGGL